MEKNATRREFLKATGTAAAVATFGAAPGRAQEKTASNHKPLTKVNCFSEDGDLKDHLMSYAGTIPNVDWEILNPRVDLYGRTAVLTFRCKVTDKGKIIIVWKGTAVYDRTGGQWKKVHQAWMTTVEPPPS